MTKPCQLSMFWLCCFVANFYTGKFQYNDHLATGIFLLFLVHKAKLIKARPPNKYHVKVPLVMV